ncbi:MAG: HEAT repeat domain-containing protein [Balneolaceae bacterium]
MNMVSDEEAGEDAKRIGHEVSYITEEGLTVELWASEKLLGDPIALHADPQGRILVTVTNRRSRSEVSVGRNGEWMIESLGMTSVEDRRRFLREALSPEKSDENSRITDHNEDGSHDWRDLTVVKEEVWRLEDQTGNGMANWSQLYIRDFHEEVTDLAGGVFSFDDAVYVTVGPDLWKVEDTNNDGMGDRKESLSHGYNIHVGISGHGMSGITMGPDGRLYWGVGDHGLNVTSKEGEQWFYPAQGAILRSEPDGSNFEVFAAGLRNTHEFVFDKYGNMISVDHDGDFAGEMERLVHIVEGSDSGWRTYWQFGKYTDPLNNDYHVWMDEGYSVPRFEGQTAHILPPIAEYHTGPTGMTYNPGTALGQGYADHFFVTSFPATPARAAIHAFTLKENGATFELENDRQILTGILATGLDVGPDGALYVADWIQGWGPNGEGRIWKLDVEENHDTSVRTAVRELLSRNFTTRSAAELRELLTHTDMRIRQKAQFELAERMDLESFLTILEDSGHQLARIHSIWGIGQILRSQPETSSNLVPYLRDPDPEIVAQTLKVLGDVRYADAAGEILDLFGHSNDRVQFFAAEAVGRMEYSQAQGRLIDLLETNDNRDLYLRHATVLALSRIGDRESLAALTGHSSRAVRLGAVAALSRMRDSYVARFLQDTDEAIVTDAARGIHDDEFIEEALEDLAYVLDQERFMNEPLIRRSISANLHIGTPESAARLARFALRQEASDSIRAEAVLALSVWPAPSRLDRVTGRYRGTSENNIADARSVIGQFVHLLSDPLESLPVKLAVLQAVTNLEYEPGLAAVFSLLEEDPSAEVRAEALETVAQFRYERLDEAVQIALEDGDPVVRARALTIAPTLSLEARALLELLQPVLENGTLLEQRRVLEILGGMDVSNVIPVMNLILDRLSEGTLSAGLLLELTESVHDLGDEALTTRLEDHLSGSGNSRLESRYTPLLSGGDRESGESIFFQNPAAQCIRCHAVQGQGGDAGPDLSFIGRDRSREELLQSLVEPSAEISVGYGAVEIRLSDEEPVYGVLEAETDSSVTIHSGGGVNRTIARFRISGRTNLPSSMPSMESVLSARELRDLVEYLKTLTGDSG